MAALFKYTVDVLLYATTIRTMDDSRDDYKLHTDLNSLE